MKVAIIGDRGIPARYSGFSTLVEELAVRLVQAHGMHVSVYCRSSYYDDKPPEYEGVRCIYLPSPGGKSFESIVHSNLAILHASMDSYDLAFIVDPGNAPFSLPLMLRRVPTVFHTDGLGWQREKWSPTQKRYYRWSEKICAKAASWLVTDSRAMQDYYREQHGVPSSFIPYSGEVGQPPDDSCLEEYGLERNGYYLVVARVEPENNIDLIIREYREANLGRPLVIVGGARYESVYSQSIFSESDESVRCLGAIFESAILNGLYENCYAYVHGHEVGGTNPSLLRAMHAGAACIPIDVVFHREVMGEDGTYYGKASGELSEILQELDANPERVAELGRLGRERSDSLYRWDAVAAGYAELFETVLRARKDRVSCQKALSDEVYRPWEFGP